MTDESTALQAARTAQGIISGVPAPAHPVTVFRGIPFAAPPVGDRRWREPQPPAPWQGVLVADTLGAIPPQTQVGFSGPKRAMSEDCLFLNVWTGAPSPDEKRPVLVWIYGGRFTFGHGGHSAYDGAGLASRGVVVVTFNYRTGVFGFLATPELSRESGHGASGNYGILDQVAALRWVHENIAAFGGDPDRVTIAGQSAGAASVLQLLGSPLAVGLFGRAIVQSGAVYPSDPLVRQLAASYRLLSTAEEEGTRYAREHGATSLAELRALSMEKLLEGNDANEDGARHGPPLFRPVLDRWVCAKTYHELLTDGPASDVPLMIGGTRDEDGASPNPSVTLDQFVKAARANVGDMASEFLSLYPVTSDAEAAAMTNTSARDRMRTSRYLWARDWTRTASSAIYTYFWTHAPPGEGHDTAGAYHGSEINYAMGNLYATKRPWDAVDRYLADTFSEYTINFAATGDPNGPGLEQWAPTRADDAVTMEVGDQMGRLSVADAARREFWERFFKRHAAW